MAPRRPLLLVLLLLFQLALLLQEGRLVEGIFFLDLLCATRIGTLEGRVASLEQQLNRTSAAGGTRLA